MLTTRIHEVLKIIKVAIDQDKKLIVNIRRADLAKDAADASRSIFKR